MRSFGKYMWQKGQDIVEYALMLAILLGIGGVIYMQTDLAKNINNVFFGSTTVLEAAKRKSSKFDPQAMMDYIDKIQKKFNGDMMNGHNYLRGLVASGWLTEADDKQMVVDAIGTDTLKYWTYYNSLNGSINASDKGLYWSTEDINRSDLTQSSGGWSNEKVLSYYYSSADKQYYVIKNNIWMNGNKTELAAKSQEYSKPASDIVGTYSTYDDAQKAYEEAKEKNGGSYIFK